MIYIKVTWSESTYDILHSDVCRMTVFDIYKYLDYHKTLDGTLYNSNSYMHSQR